MGAIVFQAAKIVVYSAAAACSVLLVGGAVKKVLTDPADECIGSGKELGRSLVGVSLQLSGARATAALTKGRG
jgi:hypothetical protein